MIIIIWKCKIYRPCVRNPGSELLQIDHKSEKWQDVTIGRHDVIVIFYDVAVFFFVMFSYWSKFHVNHVNIITGVIAIFVYKGLTKNPEIGKTLSELCPISEDWDKLGILNLARMFLTKRFCMLQNARVTAFTASELLRKNLQGGGGGGRQKLPPLPIHPD